MANKILVSYSEFEATVNKLTAESDHLQSAIERTSQMIDSLESNWESKSARAFIAKLKQKLTDYRAAKQKVDDNKQAIQEVEKAYQENESSIEQQVNALDDSAIFTNT